MKGVLQISLFIAFWTLALALTLVIFALPFLVLHLCLLLIDANGRAKRALARLDKTLMKGEEIIAKMFKYGRLRFGNVARLSA